MKYDDLSKEGITSPTQPPRENRTITQTPPSGITPVVKGGPVEPTLPKGGSDVKVGQPTREELVNVLSARGQENLELSKYDDAKGEDTYYPTGDRPNYNNGYLDPDHKNYPGNNTSTPADSTGPGSTPQTPTEQDQLRDRVTSQLTNPTVPEAAKQNYTTHIEGIMQRGREQGLSEAEIQKLIDAEELKLTEDMKVQEQEKLVAQTVGTQDPIKVTEAEAADLGEAATAEDTEQLKAQEYEASVIDTETLTKAFDKISQEAPMEAASVADKMTELTQDLEKGEIPMWARASVANVEKQLAARGLSASSVGKNALFNSIIEAAMPIASADAQMEQQANSTNYQAKVNAIMSDVSMGFAAKQFNAQSENQAKQFNAQMVNQVNMSNAARQDAINQFNATEINKQTQLQGQLDTQVSQFNAQQANQMRQVEEQLGLQRETFNVQQMNEINRFNSQMEQQRQQFNAQQAAVVAQSNVNWRRQMNTQDTAGINAVNQANAQNAFNLSNQSLSFLWQEMRDEAQWEYLADENEKQRKNQLELTLLANESAAASEKATWFTTAAKHIINGTIDKWLG